VEHVPLIAEEKDARKMYFKTKREKLGHKLP